MRKLTLLLLAISFCIPLYAETEIPLKEKDKGGNGYSNERPRTEIIIPSASINGGVINIETELSTWGVTVTIYSSDGAIVYSSVSSVEGKVHEFAVGTLPADNYTIEVQIGSELYEGDFTL